MLRRRAGCGNWLSLSLGKKLKQSRSRRALIVNCYADETRRPVARGQKIPNSLGPVFLAGGFKPDRWEIRLHNEMSDGPLENEHLLGWPDILVMTGLTTALDRMKQVTAYARSKNPSVIVVMGGHLARAFPIHCARYFDYVCQGDVEEICEVISEAFGSEYASTDMVPRYDLAPWIGWVGYAETTRNCNFGCNFCVLSAEGRPYTTSTANDVRMQLDAMGERRYVLFLDNNFYGSDRSSFRERVAVAKEGWERGQYRGWGTLVTNDFYLNRNNLPLVKDAGCTFLFSGVESFDQEWNALQNKRQNGIRPQMEVIQECLEMGIVFFYGLMLDLGTRSISDIRSELDYVVAHSEITLPAFLSVPVPIPGTPLFRQLLEDRRLLPRTKVRDLDSTTISMDTVDPLDEAAEFLRGLQSFRGYRRRVLKHTAGFWWRYRNILTSDQMLVAISNGALCAAPLLATVPTKLGGKGARRTHISTTEPLDRFYVPAFRVDARYAGHFEPTMLTDRGREISEDLYEDVHGIDRAGEASVPLPVVSGVAP